MSQQEPQNGSQTARKAKAYGIELSISALFGIALGYSAKKGIKKLLPLIAGTFIALQVLAHKGYVNIEWNRMEQDAVAQLDMDNDGRLTQKDGIIMYKKAIVYLGYKIPSISALAVGAGIGFKYV